MIIVKFELKEIIKRYIKTYIGHLERCIINLQFEAAISQIAIHVKVKMKYLRRVVLIVLLNLRHLLGNYPYILLFFARFPSYIPTGFTSEIECFA
jgi:hypothetical protein